MHSHVCCSIFCMQSEVKQETLTRPHCDQAWPVEQLQQMTMSDSKPEPLNTAHLLHSISTLNQIPFPSVLQWTGLLLAQLHHKLPPYRKKCMPKLQLAPFQDKQQYFCSLVTSQHQFLTLKVYNTHTQLVYYRILAATAAINIIRSLIKKVPTSSQLVLWDQTDSGNLLTQLIEGPFIPNLAYLHSPLSSHPQLAVHPKCLYEKVGHLMLFCPKRMLKRVSILQAVQQHIQCEQQDIALAVSLAGPEILDHQDWLCLILHLGKHSYSQQPFSPQHLKESLGQAMLYLSSISYSYNQVGHKHFPVDSEALKNKCSSCLRKKTHVVCSGCSQAQGCPVYLCIGTCFLQHHQTLKALQGWQPATTFKWFDQKWEQITNYLLALDHQQLQVYLRYVNARTMKGLNRVASHKVND